MYWNKIDCSLFIVSENEHEYFVDACGNPYAVYVYPLMGVVKMHFIEDDVFISSRGPSILAEARARLGGDCV